MKSDVEDAHRCSGTSASIMEPRMRVCGCEADSGVTTCFEILGFRKGYEMVLTERMEGRNGDSFTSDRLGDPENVATPAMTFDASLLI